jgi:multicomponent Na+:H+ antiporter subunit D
VPPLSGFWPKVLLVKASLDAEAYWIAGIALTTGLLTLYTMGKVWSLAFWKARSESETAAPTGVPEIDLRLTPGALPFLLTPVVLLALISVMIGFWAEPLIALTGDAASALLDPRGYISAVLGPGS